MSTYSRRPISHWPLIWMDKGQGRQTNCCLQSQAKAIFSCFNAPLLNSAPAWPKFTAPRRRDRKLSKVDGAPPPEVDDDASASSVGGAQSVARVLIEGVGEGVSGVKTKEGEIHHFSANARMAIESPNCRVHIVTVP